MFTHWTSALHFHGKNKATKVFCNTGGMISSEFPPLGDGRTEIGWDGMQGKGGMEGRKDLSVRWTK